MDNDTILSCPICNYPKLREYGNGIYRCDFCETYFDKDENIVPTEQEWLQTCTTEQLAKVLYHMVCFTEPLFVKCMRKQTDADAEKAIIEWLKQPHTPKE